MRSLVLAIALLAVTGCDLSELEGIEGRIEEKADEIAVRVEARVADSQDQLTSRFEAAEAELENAFDGMAFDATTYRLQMLYRTNLARAEHTQILRDLEALRRALTTIGEQLDDVLWRVDELKCGD